MPEQLLLLLPPEAQAFLLHTVLILDFAIPTWMIIAAGLTILLCVDLLQRLVTPKYYFFVRHGQTVNNVNQVRQGADGGLTPSGVTQAERTGALLQPFRIRKIYASPFERTRQTAEILRKHLRCRIIYSQLLAERRNPTEIIGKSMNDPDVHRISDMMDLTFHTDEYRFSDEENFTDLKKRAARALRYLSHRPQKRICVVTHGIFLKMALAFILHGNALHAPEWTKLSFINHSDNGGLTLAVYRRWRRFDSGHGWEILSYNITVPTDFSPASGQGIANLTELLR